MKKSYHDTLNYCKKTIVSSVFVELFQNAVTIGAATVLGDFANAVFEGNTGYASEKLLVLIICVVANVILVPLISYWGDTVCIKESISYDIHMFEQFLKIQYEKAIEIPVGEVKSRLESDVIMFRNSIILLLARMIIMPVSLIAILILMKRVSTLYMLIACVLSLIVLIMPFLTKRLNARYDDESRQYQAEAAARSYELVILAPFVKLYNLSLRLLDNYHCAYQKYYDTTQRKELLLKAVLQNVATFVNAAATIGILVSGAVLNALGIISAGDIMAMAGYYAALLGVMETLGFVVSRIAVLKKVEARIAVFYDYEDTEAVAKSRTGGEVLGYPVLQVAGVGYYIEERELFHNVSFEVQCGQKVAMIGRNGTGKSTLLNMITGLYCNYIGQIRCDEYSYVPQQAFVINDTVRENVRFGNTQCSEERIDQVMKELGIYELRDQIVNVKSNNLSGGELQRISLARAILRDKPFLIMDEPDNHLDYDSVEWIKQFIQTTDSALLYVTHDPQMVCLADKIIELGGNQQEAEN